MARVSIVVPFHWMHNWPQFLTRCLESIQRQSFTDYEVILTKAGSMPVNTNRAMQAAKGEFIKILFMDDYFAHANALQEIVDNLTPETNWLVTGCEHDNGQAVGNYHEPRYTQDIHTGNNCIGSPSVLTLRREGCLYFDERLSWLLDCDLYKRLYATHGSPTIVNTPNVIIGVGEHQTSVRMPPEEKHKEFEYLKQKFS